MAEIFEKQKAQEIYDSIVDEGGNAAPLLQKRPQCTFGSGTLRVGRKDSAQGKAAQRKVCYENKNGACG
ncbi:MAG: hypothetical protein ACLFQB_12775 [Chitinispirillaceae bacterium]